MHCPKCKAEGTKVIDSRIIEGGFAIRRRRECVTCGYRFTTYERIDMDFMIIKKDGRREPYNREKLISGIRKACHKRPISEDAIANFVSNLEAELIQKGEKEIPSFYIGEKVMETLKKWDKIAYIRFASVYKEFKDVSEFIEQIESLKNTELKKENDKS